LPLWSKAKGRSGLPVKCTLLLGAVLSFLIFGDKCSLSLPSSLFLLPLLVIVNVGLDSLEAGCKIVKILLDFLQMLSNSIKVWLTDLGTAFEFREI